MHVFIPERNVNDPETSNEKWTTAHDTWISPKHRVKASRNDSTTSAKADARNGTNSNSGGTSLNSDSVAIGSNTNSAGIESNATVMHSNAGCNDANPAARGAIPKVTKTHRKKKQRRCKTNSVGISGVVEEEKKNRRGKRLPLVPLIKKLTHHPKQGSSNNEKEKMVSLVEHSCADVENVTTKGSSCINKQNLGGNTLLHMAVLFHCMPCLEKLIESHANLNIPNNEGYTPLMYACERKYFEISDILLKYGAKSNGLNQRGNTVAHIAANKGQYDNNTCLKTVLKYSLDVNVQNHTGMTPMHMVLFQPAERDADNISILCALIREGVNFYAQCRLKEIYQGRPVDAFQLAVLLSQVPAVILLAESGYRIPLNLLSDWAVDHRSRYPGCIANPGPLRTYLKDKSCSAQSLLSLCRISVKKVLPRSHMIAHVGLPKQLMEYVSFVGLENRCLEVLQELKYNS